MPTYDYVCGGCGAALEIFQSMSEGPRRKCPECGALKLQRQIGTGAGILFKGSGFYETDYRSKSYTEAAQAESSAKSDKKSGADDKAKEAKAPETPKAKDGGTAGASGSKGGND